MHRLERITVTDVEKCFFLFEQKSHLKLFFFLIKLLKDRLVLQWSIPSIGQLSN